MDEEEVLSCRPLQLPSLINEIDNCIQVLGKTWTCLSKTEYESVVKQCRYSVLHVINKIKTHSCISTSHPSKEDLKRDIFQVQVECEFEETKIDHLRKEWTQQQNKMARVQESIYKKCRLLSLHSNYCSTQGCALCSILAVLTERKDVVEIFLTDVDKYLVDFVKIADGCLFSFIRSYANDVPLVDSTDYRFVLALYTVLSNVTMVAEGCMFFVKREECQKALWSLIHVLPRIEYSTAENLIIMLWKILLNVAKDADGKIFLQECSELPRTLEDYLKRKYHPLIHKYTLETLEQISKNIVSQEFLDKITTMQNVQRLKELSGSMYNLVKVVPKRILQNISRAAEKLMKKRQNQAQVCPSTGLIPCDCDTKPSSTATPSKSLGIIATKNIIRLPPDQKGPVRVCIKQRFTPITRKRPSTASFADCSLYPPSHASSPYPTICHFDKSSCDTCILQGPSPYAQPQTPSSTCDQCPYCKAFGPMRSSQSVPYDDMYKRTFVSSSSDDGRSATPTSVRYSFKPTSSSSSKHAAHSGRCKSFTSPSGNIRVRISNNNSRPSSSCCKNTQMPSMRNLSAGKKSHCVMTCIVNEKLFERPQTIPVRKSKSLVIFSKDSVCIPASTQTCSIHSIKIEEESELVFSDKQNSFSFESLSSATIVPCSTEQTTTDSSTLIETKANVALSSTMCIDELPSLSSNTSTVICEKSYIPIRTFKQVSEITGSSVYFSTHSCGTMISDKGSYVCVGKKRSAIPIAVFRKSTSNELNETTKSKSSNPCCIPKPKCSKLKQKISTLKDSQSTTSTSKAVKIFYDNFSKNLNQADSSKSQFISREVSSVVQDEEINIYADAADDDEFEDLLSEPDIHADICTCGSVSEKQLAPWNPTDHMIVNLGERDRRVNQHSKTMKIVSRIQNKTCKRRQKVITRIRISNLPFHRPPSPPPAPALPQP